MTRKSLTAIAMSVVLGGLAIASATTLAGVPAASPALTPLHRSLFSLWRSRHWSAIDGQQQLVRWWTVHYRAHNGSRRIAIIVLPRWYGPHDHPAIPLVISPHGRGVHAKTNARIWGNMPALGRFAVVNPEGQGNVEELYSWGSPAQIADLARMPRIVRHALPWLRIERHHVYAIGGSMGGQETLLLLADHPRMLAGAIAFDAPTNMAARYRAFRGLRHGLNLQQLARLEFGGVPRARHHSFADRSPIYYSREIAFSGVPLEIWWSRRDRIVVDGAHQSGLLYRAIKRLNPRAPVEQFVGVWRHTAEMRAIGRMPLALSHIGLLDLRARR